MNEKVHYTHCPVCKSETINPLLTVKDFTVSGEEFVVWQCDMCTVRFTQDVPDASSIAPYYKSENYISHTNAAKGLVNQLYLKVRNYTLGQKADLISEYTRLKSGHLLDVGAGTGAFLNTMKQRGWDVKGLEPDEDARKLAETLHGVTVADSSQLFEFQPRSFDAITLWHVLEHVHDLHDYIKQLKNILRKDGRLFIAVPNYTSLDASHYGPFWAAYDVPRHLYHFTPKSIEVLLKQHGLSLEAKKPMWFDSFYISMLSTKYHRGKTNMVGSFFNGLRSNVKAAFDKDRCSSIIYIIKKG